MYLINNTKMCEFHVTHSIIFIVVHKLIRTPTLFIPIKCVHLKLISADPTSVTLVLLHTQPQQIHSCK